MFSSNEPILFFANSARPTWEGGLGFGFPLSHWYPYRPVRQQARHVPIRLFQSMARLANLSYSPSRRCSVYKVPGTGQFHRPSNSLPNRRPQFSSGKTRFAPSGQSPDAETVQRTRPFCHSGNNRGQRGQNQSAPHTSYPVAILCANPTSTSIKLCTTATGFRADVPRPSLSR